MNRSHRSASPEKRSRLATLFLLASLLAVPLVLYGSFLASADANTSTLPAADPTSAQTAPTGCCSDEEEDSKPHLLAASYYSVKKNLSAKLLLNNKGPRTLEVKPTLFSLGGERYDIYPITLEGNSFQMIDMGEWIHAAGTQFQEGSIQVFHLGRDLVLGSQVYLVNERRSLSFEEKLVEPAGFPSSRLQGLWWLPSPNGEVLLAVSNTSDLPVTVQASANGAKPTQKASVTVELGPHETRLMDVAHDIFGDNRGTMSTFGALYVEHNGQSGAVLARGMAQDAAQGYSLAVQFSDPSASKSTKLQGAGLRLKEAGHEAVKPIVVAHNAGPVETTITGRLPYRASDGSTAIVSMPEVRLFPGETTTINVAKALRLSGVPDDVTAASIEFEYTNEPGSVLISALSVSDSGNQLFRLPLWDIAAQRSATGGYPWYVDGTSSTYVYLKNVTDATQQYTFQLDFEGGGVYSLGLKTVEPRQAVTIDIRALRDEQAPDANGNTIPPSATRGQVKWSIRGPDVLAMIGRSEQVDTEKAVSNNYACQNCCGDSLDTAWKVPDTDQTIEGGGVTFYDFREQDRNCYGQLLTSYSVNGIATWTSTDTSVATVSGGYVFGQGPGNTGIHGNWDAYVRYWQGGGAPGCRSTLIPMHLANGVFVVRLKILQDGNDITGTTHDVIVGQKISLTAQVEGGSGSNPQWTIPPTRIGNYVVTCNGTGTPPRCGLPTSGGVTEVSGLTTSAVDFYWVDGGDGRQVQHSVTVGGINLTKTATFNVKRPTAAVTTSTGTIAVDSAWNDLTMHFGILGSAGISFSRTLTIPAGFSGDTAWVQTVTPLHRRKLNDGAWERWTGAGLDETFPYDSTASTNDSPRSGALTSSYLEYTTSDSFEMWLMFKPSGASSIWVPLRRVPWSWSGTTVRSGATWSLSSSSHSVTSDADSTAFPIWTYNSFYNQWVAE
ncbi:MAG: hypothetical protein ACR2HX_24735 [Pyrinomonadaceae bacterium]